MLRVDASQQKCLRSSLYFSLDNPVDVSQVWRIPIFGRSYTVVIQIYGHDFIELLYRLSERLFKNVKLPLEETSFS